jgi:molybdopterin converting factor small subunit
VFLLFCPRSLDISVVEGVGYFSSPFGSSLRVSAMPQVKVNLYASLRAYTGGSPSVDVEIDPGQTLEEVLGKLGVPLDQTKILFVNHRTVGLDQPLQGGERVGVFPAVGGG